MKVFPSSGVGHNYIKDIKAPLPQIPLIPTGGINIENAADFIKAGSAALGVGSALVSNSIIESGDFEILTQRAKDLITAVKSSR